MDHHESRSPPPPFGRGRGRAERSTGSQSQYDKPDTTPPTGWQSIPITIVTTLIGRNCVGVELENFICDLEDEHYERCLREGRFSQVGNRRVSQYRCRDADIAAVAWYGLKLIYGLPLPTYRKLGNDLGLVHPAQLTPAGAASITGQKLAAALRETGIEIVPEPLAEHYPGEFDWVDALTQR